ncbi:MAG: TetR/AcrR family transcriptional regulator [Microthrixaceae bacterium]
MSRTTRIDLEPLLGALTSPEHDENGDRILDATLESLVDLGLRRCTVEEVAERANIGRSTIYRRFDDRDGLIHAVVARELRRVLDAVNSSVADVDGVADRLVEGFLAGLDVARESDFLRFIRSEPDLTIFLLKDSYPAIDLVTGVLVGLLVEATGSGLNGPPGGTVDPEKARHAAEIVFRLAISFVLVPTSTLPLDDRDAARKALHTIFDPLLEAATCPP